jgi:hypothetical protein
MTSRIFLDTSVLRHAADRRIVGRPYTKTLNWGGSTVLATLVRWVEEYPNERLTARFRRKLSLLPLFAHLAKRRRVELLSHHEVRWELAGLPPSHDSRGLFYGAPITMVPDPFPYGRVIAGAGIDASTVFVQLLLSVDDPEFLQIQKATGARQGQNVSANQLLDAFHILCADRAGADFFLTTDLKLVRSVRAQAKHAARVPIVDPGHLVRTLLGTRILRFGDGVSFVPYQLRTCRRGPADHPLEQLRTMTGNTDRDR